MSKKILVFSLSFAAILLVWYFLFDKAPLQGDWQEQLAVISTAEFNGDLVMVKNVRNFRYYPTEADIHPAYYDKTYDLTQIKKVWYVTEPFNENTVAAHTFVSFEFNNGDFLSISIGKIDSQSPVTSPPPPPRIVVMSVGEAKPQNQC